MRLEPVLDMRDDSPTALQDIENEEVRGIRRIIESTPHTVDQRRGRTTRSM
jgi:hypothetical protein